MIGQPQEILPPPTGASWKLDAVIEVLMAGFIALVPLTLTSRPLWGEPVMHALVGGMGICLGVKLALLRGTRLVTSWSFVVGGLFVLLVVVQLVRLPRDLACTIAPSLGEVKGQLLAGLAGSRGDEATMQLSFYPLATRGALRLLLVGVTVLIVTVNVYRTPGSVKRLLGWITAIGTCLAVLSLGGTYFASGRNRALLSFVPISGEAESYLTKVRTAQYMSLSIGAGLGLLLIKLKEIHSRTGLTWSDFWAPSEGTKDLRIVCCLVSAIVLCAATGLSLGARSAIIAILLASSLTLAGVSFRLAGKRKSWVFPLLTLAGLGSAAAIGSDVILKRLGSSGVSQIGSDLRGVIDACATAVRSLPVIGAGLGTSEVAYPIFERSFSSEGVFAGNHYAQLAMETGIVGVILVLIFSVIVSFSYARLVGRAHVPSQFAVFGIGFALLTMVIHAFGRSGQIPFPLLALGIILSGLIVSLGRTAHGGNGVTRAGRMGRVCTRLVAVVLTSVIVAGSAWSFITSVDTCKAEAHWAKADAAAQQLSRSRWEDPGGPYAVLFTHASEAVTLRPDNVAYRTGWNTWRWRAATRTGHSGIDQVPHTPEILATASEIVEQLEHARSLCPTYGPAYSLSGQLETYVLDMPAGKQNIRTGYVLSRDDPRVCFAAGMLDAREGRTEGSLKKLRRCVQLDRSFIPDVNDVYIRQLNRPDLGVRAAEGNISWLLHVADRLESVGAHRDLSIKARDEALQLAEAKCRQPAAPPWAFACAGSLYVKKGEYDRAIASYRRALALDYARADWRMSLARALVKVGRVREALHEGRICLRFRPESSSARSLVSKLCMLADAGGAK